MQEKLLKKKFKKFGFLRVQLSERKQTSVRHFKLKFQNSGVKQMIPKTSREKMAGFTQRTEKEGRLWTSNR